jgi:putative CocE/NonD family hydrolase
MIRHCFYQRQRLRVLLILLTGLFGPGNSPAATNEEKITRESVFVPMRDGITLAANINRDPGQIQALPALLLSTPYDQEGFEGQARILASHGYVAITLDARGRYDSGGEYPMLIGEGRDGFDTIEWIRKQSWCNGKVGMWGGSHMGLAQWMTAAQGANIDAMAPRATAGNVYRDFYTGGVFRLAFIRMTYSGNLLNPPPDPDEILDWPKALLHLPLTGLDKAVGRPSPWYMSFLKHNKPDGFWKPMNALSEVEHMDIPMQHIVGYYDFFCRGLVSGFYEMRYHSATAHSRKNQQLILGAWSHISRGAKVEDMDFSQAAGTVSLYRGWVTENLAWFDRFLKGIGTDKPWPPVLYFSMGENRWYEATDWPPSGVRSVPFYLHSGGNANTRKGDGKLERFAPSTSQRPDQFTADPDDPVPTAPGREEIFIGRFGPFDQQLAQDRDDILVYSTSPLKEPIRIAGPISAELYTSANTPDADWVVKLIDVYPSGFAHPLATGIQRGSARESYLHLSLLEPGKVYRITVDLGHTAALIDRGHKLCVQIQGSNFPVYDRNTNTGEGPTGSRTLVSTETIYHTPEQRSSIWLPLVVE